MQQILNWDEDGIKRAWSKANASAGRNPAEKDYRLAYLTWRVWCAAAARLANCVCAFHTGRAMRIGSADLHREGCESAQLTRADALLAGASLVRHMRQKKARVEAEELQRMATGTTDFDPSELGNASELDSALDGDEEPPSPGAFGSVPPSPPSSPRLHDLLAASARPGVRGAPVAAPQLAPLPKGAHSASGLVSQCISPPVLTHRRTVSCARADTPDVVRGQPLYLVLISLHGLVRGHEMELGRDADTGGQVKYVVELSRALAKHPGVHRVELLTRLIAGAQPAHALLRAAPR